MTAGDRGELARLLSGRAEAAYERARGTEMPVSTEDGADLLYVAGCFTPEVEKRSEVDGFRLVSGEVRLWSGHHFHALLALCLPDACEHYGTLFLLPDAAGDLRLVDQSDARFKSWIEAARRADPSLDTERGYRYRYFDASLRANDPHVGEDGWSVGG